MKNAITDMEKDEQKKDDPFECLTEDIQLIKSQSLSKRLVRKIEPKNVMALGLRKSLAIEICIKKSFLRGIPGLTLRIPKCIVSVDEKYLRHCLYLVQVDMLTRASVNNQSRVGVLCDGQISGKVSSGRRAFDLAKFVVQCPLAAGTENVLVNSNGDWIPGKITNSKSTMNILGSPLLYQLGPLGIDSNFGRAVSVDLAELPICSDHVSSSGGLSVTSRKLQKETSILGEQKYESEPIHRRVFSVSSSNTTSSDQSSLLTPAAVYQGMLQCTWKEGCPHHVFSVDGHKEVYVADLFKVESADEKYLDCIYVFHSRTGSKTVHDIVGKMKVSTSFALCPNNSKILETHFVLFGSEDYCAGEMQTSSHTLRKNKGMTKKVVDAFRTSPLSKPRSFSKLGTTTAILEHSSQEPCQDSIRTLESTGSINLSENHFLPNLELAAVVVKEHIHENLKEGLVGGWGLKFLKKVGMGQTDNCTVTLLPSECCRLNDSDGSTSMDVLVPAGFHGGPRIRNGGPSSLTERWMSGGCCDCGGWDIGCPLTILNTKPSKKEDPSITDVPGNWKTFDLYIQGSKKSAPVMKMVNIHEGLYYIHFRSNLSALQSFSIAAAIIHTRGPTLHPYVYRS